MDNPPPPTAPAPESVPLPAAARTTLRGILAEEPNWIGIHAAEALLETGDSAWVRQFLLDRLARSDASPFRVGPWRVLARTAVTPEERARWVARIEAVVVDPAAPDRVAALESLAKLDHRLGAAGRDFARRLAGDPREAETLIPLWALALAGEPDALGRIRLALRSPEPIARRRAGYVLRWLRVTDPAILAELARAADAEPPGTDIHAFLVSAALQRRADPARLTAWQRQLEDIILTGITISRYEACQALAGRCPPTTLAQLAPLLASKEGDVRIGAALVILSAGQAR
ncbi:MAG: hypothetical protein JNG83_11120 [Opitutaceae bacterium]|nr:hypothetical protein [Opitutaceae bacterium]